MAKLLKASWRVLVAAPIKKGFLEGTQRVPVPETPLALTHMYK
jgi:hypothetical protein